MKVELLSCALGAQISDIRLAEAATNADLAAELNDLLIKHKVLFFRDQDMTDAQHAGVARQFGDLEDHPLANSADGEPGIIHIWKSPESQPQRYENAWHADATWRDIPPMGAVLRCVECPPVGGDTMWANMELAFETARPYQGRYHHTARAPQHGIELHGGQADRRTAGDEGALSRSGASGRSDASHNRQQGAVCLRVHNSFHQLSHCRAGTGWPGFHRWQWGAAPLPDLPGGHSRIPGPLALDAGLGRFVG